MVRTIHDGIVEDLRTLRESIDKYSHRGVEKNVKDLKSFAEAILVKLNPDKESDLNFIELLIYMIRHYDEAKLIGNVKASLDAYLSTEEQLKELEEEEETENHNKFYKFMKDLQENLSDHFEKYWTALSSHSALYATVEELSKSCNESDARFAKQIMATLEDPNPNCNEKAQSLKIILHLYFDSYGVPEPEGTKMSKFYTCLSKLKTVMNTSPLSAYEKDLGEHSCLNRLLFKVAENTRDRAWAQSMIDVIKNKSLTSEEKAKKLESRIDSYMTLYDNKEECAKMNHAAFYDKMKRMAETMTKIQDERPSIGVAEYLRDVRYSGEWADVNIEDEKDKEFLKDFLSTITHYSDADDIVQHCFAKLKYYLDDNTVKKEETKTTHEEMIEMAKCIRSTLVTLKKTNASDDCIAANTFSIINNLKSKLPVAYNNDDRFIKQMVEISHNYRGPKLLDNLIATIDQWYEFEVEDPNLISIDELSKKISNKKKMDKETVGYTILCEMKNLVEQTTAKLANNIEEEDFSSTMDKRLINRDLQSLLNSYSNILEILGQYYVKLEK